MSDNARIGTVRPKVLAPISDHKRAAPSSGGESQGGGQRKVVRHDPFDLQTAFYRLSLLLERDDGAPPENVPRRGYYLNVLV
ncbi:MAG: hypothetical protein HRT36_03850 [Alphaproteobacteria bacterium]|nr:hypothetical protein [Alphaproteobacteria bacterium]